MYKPSAPKECGNGHRLGPGKVVVAFRHCSCTGAGVGGGHITYRCRVCDHVTAWGCVDETKRSDYQPG